MFSQFHWHNIQCYLDMFTSVDDNPSKEKAMPKLIPEP
nr:MAG TPA: hypothetical protein [Caudoviricetes sp.]